MSIRKERIERGKKLWRYERENLVNGLLVAAAILTLSTAQALLTGFHPFISASNVWLFIWVNNSIVSLVFYVITWFISFGSSVAAERCVKVWTFDCGLWRRIRGRLLLQGIGTYGLLMPFMILHSMRTYSIAPWFGVIYGLENVYGFFELAGFLMASIAGPYTTKHKILGMSLLTGGILLLLSGAFLESVLPLPK